MLQTFNVVVGYLFRIASVCLGVAIAATAVAQPTARREIRCSKFFYDEPPDVSTERSTDRADFANVVQCVARLADELDALKSAYPGRELQVNRDVRFNTDNRLLKKSYDELCELSYIREEGRTVEACRQLRPAQYRQSDPGGEVEISDVNDYLLSQATSFPRIRRWLDHLETRNGSVAVRDAELPVFEGILTETRALLRECAGVSTNARALRGLEHPIAAQLVAGPAFSSSGSELGDGNTNALARLEIETERWDGKFSVNATFGFQPALTLVESVGGNADDETENEDDSAPASSRDQEAFAWSLAPQFHFNLADPDKYAKNISLFARVGQIRLNSDSELVENTNPPFIVVPIQNDAARTEWFWEVGARFQLHFRTSEKVLREKLFLVPAFDFSAGFRNDQRFKKEGELVNFDSPEQRWFLRFRFNALQVFDHRKPAAETDGPWNVSIGVDFEGPWSSDGLSVPSTTRFLILGDLDFLKALRGGS